MATTARELAIIISASNQSGPALVALQTQLRGVQAATVGMGATSVTAAGQMGIIYGAQGQILSRLGPTAAAMNTATVSTAKMAAQTAGLSRVMMGAAGAISPVTLGLAGVGVAGVLAIKGVADAGMNWETAFTGVRKTVNATDAELAGFARGIRNMAMEIPASREEIARVAEAAGQLGIKNESLMSFTRTMIDMGVATNLSATDAAVALARLANITGMPQSNFDRLGSTVVDLGNKFETTEAEIVEMGLRIAGAGSQIGMSEAQILGWATALSSVGVEAQMGGTAISRTFMDMARAVAEGGEELTLFARVAGMDVEKFATLFRTDATAAITAFVQGLGRIKAEGGTTFEVLAQLGITEQRQVDALNRLSGGHGKLAGIMATANTAWAENTALTTEAERRYATTASKIEITKNKWTDLVVSGFEASQPVLNRVIDLVGELATGLGAVGRTAEWVGAGIRNLGTAEGNYPSEGRMTPASDTVVGDWAVEKMVSDQQELYRRLGIRAGESADMAKIAYNAMAQESSENASYMTEVYGGAFGSIATAAEREAWRAAEAFRAALAPGIVAHTADWAMRDESAEDAGYLNKIYSGQSKELKENMAAKEKFWKALAPGDIARTAEQAMAAESAENAKGLGEAYNSIAKDIGVAQASNLDFWRGVDDGAKKAKKEIDELRKAFAELASTPVAGETAFSVEEAKLQDQIAQSKFAIDAMKRGVLPRSGLGAEMKHLRDLEAQQKTLGLAKDVTVGSAQRWAGILKDESMGTDMGSADLLNRLSVARGNMGLPDLSGIINNVQVNIDSGGNVSVSADSAWGQQFGDALSTFMADFLAGGGTGVTRNQGGANPQLPGAN